LAAVATDVAACGCIDPRGGQTNILNDKIRYFAFDKYQIIAPIKENAINICDFLKVRHF
jgi:hypothetical protein